MAYKRLGEALQGFKAYYLQKIKAIDKIFLKDMAFLFGCILMLILSAMFIILIMEVLLWMK